MKNKYELDQFFGGYFHQDWDIVADTWQGVVYSFFEDCESSQPMQKIAEGFKCLLQKNYKENELEEILTKELSCDYLPLGSIKKWIDNMLVMFEDEIKRRDKKT